MHGTHIHTLMHAQVTQCANFGICEAFLTENDVRKYDKIEGFGRRVGRRVWEGSGVARGKYWAREASGGRSDLFNAKAMYTPEQCLVFDVCGA